MANKDYSLSAFNSFMDYLSEKHLLNKNTVQSRKAAANKVLGVLDEAEVADLREVDIEMAFTRFSHKEGKSYKPDSLMVYKSRLTSALKDFFSYTESPSQFRPSVKAVIANGTKLSKKTTRKDTEKNLQTEDGLQEVLAPMPQKHHDHLSIPVPLREGVIVKIVGVPADLTEAEATRLAAIIRAYAVV